MVFFLERIFRLWLHFFFSLAVSLVETQNCNTRQIKVTVRVHCLTTQSITIPSAKQDTIFCYFPLMLA